MMVILQVRIEDSTPVNAFQFLGVSLHLRVSNTHILFFRWDLDVP